MFISGCFRADIILNWYLDGDKFGYTRERDK